MKKSRTNKRRSQRRVTRRRLTRRQRGGNMINITVEERGGAGPIGFAQLSIEENSSVRSVLKQWLANGNKMKTQPEAMRNAFLRYADKTPVPNFQFFDETRKLREFRNWDESFLFQKDKVYQFAFLAKQQAQNNGKAKLQDSTDYLLNAIQHYANKRTPAKIIPLSHSTGAKDIPKNVNQTFKFIANPKTPIILYDIAWFAEEYEPWQFYNLLNFEEREDLSVGPKEYVRFYKKPAGSPFTIKGTIDPYKQAYLEEVQQKAEEAGFDEMSEVEICCVKWKQDKNDPKMIEKEERIFTLAERTGSPIYSFGSTSPIPDYIEDIRARRQRGGGKQIFIKGNDGRTVTLNITNSETPASVIEKYANKAMTTQESKDYFTRLSSYSPPLISLRYGTKTLPFREPYNFTKDTTYFINIKMSGVAHLESSKTSAATFQLLKRVIDYLNATYKMAKIITQSAAITDVIEKNVDQQFMFYKEPFTPILHVDSGFFKPDDFYNYLDFQEFTVPGIGPNSIVKFFRKPAGVPLQINPRSTISYPLKKAYLRKVQEKAAGKFDLTNEMVLVCFKHHFAEESQTSISDLIEYVASKNNPYLQVYKWSD